MEQPKDARCLTQERPAERGHEAAWLQSSAGAVDRQWPRAGWPDRHFIKLSETIAKYTQWGSQEMFLVPWPQGRPAGRRSLGRSLECLRHWLSTSPGGSRINVGVPSMTDDTTPDLDIDCLALPGDRNTPSCHRALSLSCKPRASRRSGKDRSISRSEAEIV